jgi:drug/metabolite transporter (DMT)-like permease
MTQDKSLKMKGCIYAFLAGVLWGVSSPVAQYLFVEKGIISEWLVPYRLLVSGFLLLIYAAVKGHDVKMMWKERKDALRLVIFGIFGMMGMQFIFFSAVQETNAGTATIFQYLNPAMLILFFAVIHKILPSKKEIVSVIVAVAGIVLVATHGDFSSLTISVKGGVLGIMLAVVTCLYGILPVSLLNKYSAEAVCGWGMVIGGAVLSLITRPWKIPVILDVHIVVAFFVIVVIGTILPFCFYLASVKYAGPVYAGLFSCVEPVAATVVAAVYLGTVFAKMDILGFALVLSTLFILAIPDKVKKN